MSQGREPADRGQAPGTAPSGTLRHPSQEEHFDLRHLVENVSSLTFSSPSDSSATSSPLSSPWPNPARLLAHALYGAPPSTKSGPDTPTARQGPHTAASSQAPAAAAQPTKCYGLPPGGQGPETFQANGAERAAEGDRTGPTCDRPGSHGSQDAPDAEKPFSNLPRKETSLTIAPSSHRTLSFFPPPSPTPPTRPAWPPSALSLAARRSDGRDHEDAPLPSLRSRARTSAGTVISAHPIASPMTTEGHTPAGFRDQTDVAADFEMLARSRAASELRPTYGDDLKEYPFHITPSMVPHQSQSIATEASRSDSLASVVQTVPSGAVGPISSVGPGTRDAVLLQAHALAAQSSTGRGSHFQAPRHVAVPALAQQRPSIIGSAAFAIPSSAPMTPGAHLMTQARPLTGPAVMGSSAHAATANFSGPLDAIKPVPRHAAPIGRPLQGQGQLQSPGQGQADLQQWRNTVQQQQAALSTALHLASFGIGVGPGVNPDVAAMRNSSGPNRLFSSASNPPIVNTGNLGPMCMQPGDWVCTVCSFVNWRRRKVCMRCFPFAEGNEVSTSLASGALIAAQLAAGINPNQSQLDLLTKPRGREASLPGPSTSALTSPPPRPLTSYGTSSRTAVALPSPGLHSRLGDAQPDKMFSQSRVGDGSGQHGNHVGLLDASGGTDMTGPGFEHLSDPAMRFSETRPSAQRDELQAQNPTTFAALSSQGATMPVDSVAPRYLQQAVPRYATQSFTTPPLPPSSTSSSAPTSTNTSSTQSTTDASSPPSLGSEDRNALPRSFATAAISTLDAASPAKFGSYFHTSTPLPSSGSTGVLDLGTEISSNRTRQDVADPLDAVRDIWRDVSTTGTRRPLLNSGSSSFRRRIGAWEGLEYAMEDDEDDGTLLSPQDPALPRPDPIGTKYGIKKGTAATESSVDGMFA